MNELKQLAEFACRFNIDEAPAEVVRAACFCVLDTVGSTLGAVSADDIPGLVRELSGWSLGEGGKTTVWGQGIRMDLFPAVLLNGCMSHTLEFDDNHSPSKSHPGAAIIPAAWAAAEQLGASGRDLLEAVVVGYEVMGRVGKAVDVMQVRRNGWHNTGVFGPFGAAAAVGKLLRLEPDQMLSAFGLAGTQAAGLWAFLAEGATCKKLNCAKAGVNGLIAAILAKGGMTGPAHTLEAEDGGLYRAVAEDYDMAVITRDLGTAFEITRVDKKPYPCCRSTHPSIDAALRLRAECALDPAAIRSVVVDTYKVAVFQCGFTNYPCNAVEAKFSIPYLVSAAFVEGQLTMREFLPDTFDNALVRRLAACVTVREDPMFTRRYYQPRWGCRMTVTMDDGTAYTVQIDDASGSCDTPMTGEQETAKFLALGSLAFAPDRLEALRRDILALDRLPALPSLA